MKQPAVAVVIATKDREALLTTRAAPSVEGQLYVPERVVVVNDGQALSTAAGRALGAALGSWRLAILDNARSPGPAGAWNTALDYLSATDFEGFVALLDDDDEWEPAHLLENVQAADSANIVVSGLMMFVDGEPRDRPLIQQLRVEDFLVGNPGWQGSNTFVRLDLLRSVGGFQEHLASLHDRDVAVRLLDHPRASPALVPRWTATWHLDTRRSLSAPRSPAKIKGLRTFWALHGHRMDDAQRGEYFRRAERLFGFTADAILGDEAPLPVSRRMCHERPA